MICKNNKKISLLKEEKNKALFHSSFARPHHSLYYRRGQRAEKFGGVFLFSSPALCSIETNPSECQSIKKASAKKDI